MLSRHATPNTSITATTGMMRLLGVQYWTPSSRPNTASTTRPSARPSGSSRHGFGAGVMGAFRYPIARPPRFGRDRGAASFGLRTRERRQSRRGCEPLGDAHAARHVGEDVDRDA